MQNLPLNYSAISNLSADPIGVFDSGVGGLSVWQEIVRLLPHEDTLYVADQTHMPYGSRSLVEVQHFGETICQFLLNRGAKIIVIACNTASAAALHHLRAIWPNVPFVGMEPAVKPAAEQTRTGIVGVLATQATFQGQLFASLTAEYGRNVQVLPQVGWGLAQAVEAGELDTPATETLLNQHLAPLINAGIDQLVLGCTHYPFLRPAIERILGPKITIIDPAPAIARQTARVLAQRNLQNNGNRIGGHTFYTSGNSRDFSLMFSRLIPAFAQNSQIRTFCWQPGGLKPD